MSTALWSIALRDIPAPDYADATIHAMDAHGSADAAAWARRMFSSRYAPRWVMAALGLRQAVAPLIGVPPAPRTALTVSEVGDDEVLISTDDAHLDFRVGVAVDESRRLLRVTTTVRLKNRRGRLYFLPVRLLHPIVVRACIRGAARSFTRGV